MAISHNNNYFYLLLNTQFNYLNTCIQFSIFLQSTMEESCCSADDIVVVGAQRTPIGALNGSLSTQKASSLGTIVIKSLLEKAKLNPSDVSEVILGQALTAGSLLSSNLSLQNVALFNYISGIKRQLTYHA